MKKRWIVLLLTVALLLGLAVFTMAAGEEAKPVIGPNGEMYHCVCGNQHYAGEGAEAALVVSYGECYDDCDGANHTWLPWTRQGGAYNNGDWYYYLDTNVTAADVTPETTVGYQKTVVIGVTSSNASVPALTTESNFYLDLNGHTYSADYRMFRVDGSESYSASLTISDSSKNNTGKLVTATNNHGAVVWLRYSYATANIYGGTLESMGTVSTGNGGTVQSAGTLNIYDGTITGGTLSGSYKGGNIYSTGTLKISGGTISNGNAPAGAGNIWQSGGTMTMTGGIVDGGVVKSGHCGNIRVDGNAVATITGGVISNGLVNCGTSDLCGGNLGILGTANVTIGGGESPVTITGGTARRGGNIFLYAGTLNIGSNVNISNGTATNYASDVLVNSTAALGALTLTGNPQIDEVYLTEAASLKVGQLDVDAYIGVNGSINTDTKLTTATVNAASAGCLYSTRSGYNVIYTATGNLIYSQAAASCICGADNRENGVHTEGCYLVLDSVWTEVASESELNAAVVSGKSFVRLTASIDLTAAITKIASGYDLIVDLNNYTITQTTAGTRMFQTASGGILTITDTSASGSGKLIPNASISSLYGGIVYNGGTGTAYIFGGTLDASAATANYGTAIRVDQSAVLYIHGGTIKGGTATGSGGGAISMRGTAYVTGGTITGGEHTGSSYGGGCIFANGTFHLSGNAVIEGGTTKMNGGTIYFHAGTMTIKDNVRITGGTATTNGGAIYMAGGTMTVSDNASITGGTATNGGAICMKSSTVTMNGGTITGSTVTNQGGAVYLSSTGAVFTMNGGTIAAGDNVPQGGGAIFIGGSGVFTMKGGEITAAGKTGSYGMCVCAYDGTFKMYDGTLTGGTATGSGGGALSVASSGKAYMYGGTITGGTSTNTTHGGGNIRVGAGCTMEIHGGTISGGKAAAQGGNLYILGTLTIYDCEIIGGSNTGSDTYGGNICVNSGGTVIMHDGTISGGNSKRGGNVNVRGSGSTFTLNGGTITGGTTTGSDAHGGNIHVREASTFTMNGGTISNGQAGGTGYGGNIALLSTGTKVAINGGTISGGSDNGQGPSVWVHMGADDEGSLTVSGSPVINSVYLQGNTTDQVPAQTITIGTAGLGDKARIGVAMMYPGTFVSSGASAADATKFISLSSTYYVVCNGEAIELVAKTAYTGTVAAIVGSTPFDTAQGAVNAVTDSENQYVKLMAAVNGDLTVSKNLYLNLNGNTITGNISNNGYTLYAFDSATDDYLAYSKVEDDEIKDDTYGKIIGTISGDYSAQFVTPKELFGHQYRYIAIDEGSNTYSFHRIYLGVKSVVLYPTTTAVDYKITLRCDEVVAEHITDYGVKAYATAYQTAETDSAVAVSPTQIASAMQSGILPYGEEGNENIRKVRIVNVLNDTMDLETQKLRAERFYFTVCAYITLDSQEVTSASVTNSLEEVVKKTEELVSAGSIALNTNQKYALATMYTTYGDLMEPWFEGINDPVIPSMVTATADYEVHCICGDENSTNNPCALAGHPDQAWEPWDGKSGISAAGNYYLTGSVDSYQLWLGTLNGTNGYTINLDLHGNNFTATSNQRAFGIGENTTVNLTNSSTEGGVITGKYVNATGLAGTIYTRSKSSLSLYPNVTVTTDGASVQHGGAIYVTSGALNIYGANVVGADLSANSNSYGGAIYLTGTAAAPASMTINSGKVYGTSVAEGGGAVFVGAYSTATVNGGEISGRYTLNETEVIATAKYGATIRPNATTSRLYLNGGTIVGGEATGSGGGTISNAGIIEMTGGTITGGRASSTDTENTAIGGGNINNRGTFIMTGGTITDGEAANGRGSVYVREGCTFTVSGTARIVDSPKNVYLQSGAYINIGDAGLSNGAQIGVSLPNEIGQGTFTTKANATAANAAYFLSDAGYNIVVGDNGLNVTSVAAYSVGYGAASIDPDLNDGNSYGLVGYSNEADRKATTIEAGNGLLATCLAVTDAQGNTVLLISIDSSYISPSHADTVRSKISAATGVPAGNIMISAAHQHSSPLLETNYLNGYFYPGIVNAANAAMANRATVNTIETKTVQTADASGNPQFGFIRNISLYKDGEFQGTWSPNHDDRVYRYGKLDNGVYVNYESNNTIGQLFGAKVEYKICSTVAEAKATSGYAMCYESVVDSSMQLVKFTRADASDIIMANFQVHPHLASSYQTTVITADVVGAFRNALADSTGAKVMYFSGASGNINPVSELGDTVYEKSVASVDAGEFTEDIGTAHVTYGQALANVALNGSYTSVNTGKVSAISKLVACDRSTNDGYSAEAIAAAAEIANGTATYSASTHLPLGIYSAAHARMINRRAQDSWAATTYDLTISVYSIGDIAFVAAPYEMFDTNGMAIKDGSGFAMTFVATQANGDKGYIPSQQGFENRGYSTDISYVAPGTGEQLVTEYLDLLDSLN